MFVGDAHELCVIPSIKDSGRDEKENNRKRLREVDAEIDKCEMEDTVSRCQHCGKTESLAGKVFDASNVGRHERLCSRNPKRHRRQ